MESDLEIVLVEDNPSDVELTLHSFRRNNLTNRIRVLRDGAEALEFVFGNGRYADRNHVATPSVILLDLKLPLVDGIEVLRTLKADERSHDIPVVMLTSSREDRDIQECYRLGANSYIVKPVDFEQFTEAIRQVGLYWLVINQPPNA